MKLTKIIPPAEQKVAVETFVGLVRSGIEAWQKAGELLVKLVDANPNVLQEITEQNSSITFEMLLAFERIGRHQLYPPLLMDSSPGGKKLLTLPYDVQERYSKDLVEVVVASKEGGSPVVEKRFVKELSPKEARIVFSAKGIRTVAEQLEFRRQNKVATKKKTKTVTGVAYLVQISPSNAMVLKKVTSTASLPTIKLFEKDGIRQALFRLV